jgi:SAM-dependent methyltransferase
MRGQRAISALVDSGVQRKEQVMSKKIPERLRWAVDTLAVQPDDHLLEIGCGQGVAVALICDKLVTGSITALDRSPTMIDAARERNQPHEKAGKAVFQVAALAEADLGAAKFNKIFAVNVNVFWLKPERDLAILKKLLTPSGALYLFYEPPAASKITFITDQLRQNLSASGFCIQQVLLPDMQPPCVGVIAALEQSASPHDQQP